MDGHLRAGRSYECLLLVRRKAGLGEIMLEMLDTPEGHDALTPCSTPAKGLLGLIGRVYVWVEGDLPPLFGPWKWIGLVLPIGRRAYVHRPGRLRSQWCLGGGWRVVRHWWEQWVWRTRMIRSDERHVDTRAYGEADKEQMGELSSGRRKERKEFKIKRRQ
jgi:hypothetical protein